MMVFEAVTYAMIGDLSDAACRRILALAWVRFSATAPGSELRETVREEHAAGAVTSEQIEHEWHSQWEAQQ